MAEPPADIVTFLVTDIVGSVELWQRNERAMSGALALHDRILRELVMQHGGHVVKGAGDGIWSTFDAPKQALDVAVAIQTTLRATAWGPLGELHVRVVVHAGPAEYRDGDYFGITTNRVARLLELAKGGQILVSADTIRLAGVESTTAFGMRSLGDLRLRSFRDPLLTYQLMPPSADGDASVDGPGLMSSPSFVPSYPFPTPGRLIGRRTELALLEETLQSSRTSGQVVLIGAPAGAGKSALIGALVGRAQKTGFLCLAGGAYEREGVIPLGPVRDALADYLLTEPADTAQSLRGEIVADLTAIVPELAYHLPTPTPTEAGTGQDQGRLFGAVYACLRGLAERQPVLLCLEDLHVADGSTLALLQFLIRRALRLPVVILATFRPEEVVPREDLARTLAALVRDGAKQINLTPLDRDQTGRLIASFLEGPASDRLRDSLFEATEGNPLFIEQLILTLREEGRISRHSSVWSGTDDGRLVLPSIVRDVLRRRFGRLSQRCNETLAMAAVLGRNLDHNFLVTALEPRRELDVIEDLEEAIQARVLQEMPAGYAFTHTLLREALYGSMSARRAMLLHEQAGTVLERMLGVRVAERAAELAHHFIHAGQHPSMRTKALHYSLEAGRRAAVASLHREALEHFSRACELTEVDGVTVEPESGLEALEGRAAAEFAQGLWLPLVATCERVLALSDEPLRRARALGWIGHARQRTADTEAAVQNCDRALAELERALGRPEVTAARLRLLTDKGYLMFLLGRFSEHAAIGAEMLPIAEALGQLKPIQWAHNALALAAMGRGQVDEALEHYGRFRDLASGTSDRLDQAIAHSNLGVQYQYAGEFRRARAELERAIELCREAGAEHRTINSIQRLGWVLVGEGDLQAALQQAEQARELASRASDRWAADCYDLLGTIFSHRAGWATATASFEQALRLRENGPHAAGRVETLIGLGRVRRHTGDWPGARAIFAEALATASSMEPSPWLVAARRQLGWLLCLTGEREGPGLVESALELVQTMPRSIEYGPTVFVAVELGLWRGDRAAATAALEQLLAGGVTAEQRIEIHCLLARRQSEDGDLPAARAHLVEARTLADGFGDPRVLCLVHTAAGLIAATDGDEDRAVGAFEEALAFSRAADTPYERARALSAFATLAGLPPERADDLLAEAREIDRRLGVAAVPVSAN